MQILQIIDGYVPEWTDKQKGRCEISFQGDATGLTGIEIYARHYDDSGALITPAGNNYNLIKLVDLTGDDPEPFAYDKKNSTYQLMFVAVGNPADAYYDILIA